MAAEAATPQVCRVGWDLDHLHFAAYAALAVNSLAAFFGAHAGTKADFAGAFYFADLVGVMHAGFLLGLLITVIWGRCNMANHSTGS